MKKFTQNVTESLQPNYDKTIIEITIADDWEGIYLNGKLINDDHSIRYDQVLKTLIEKKIDLDSYQYMSLHHYKNGQISDWTEEEETNLSGCTETIEEYLKIIADAGYTYEIK